MQTVLFVILSHSMYMTSHSDGLYVTSLLALYGYVRFGRGLELRSVTEDPGLVVSEGRHKRGDQLRICPSLCEPGRNDGRLQRLPRGSAWTSLTSRFLRPPRLQFPF